MSQTKLRQPKLQSGQHKDLSLCLGVCAAQPRCVLTDRIEARFQAPVDTDQSVKWPNTSIRSSGVRPKPLLTQIPYSASAREGGADVRIEQ